MQKNKYVPRTEINSELDLENMSLHEVALYAKNHPGEYEPLVRHIQSRYSLQQISALVETAALEGISQSPLIQRLASDAI
ncbi:Uncharacterised protein [uncultured archaeon]|nr:Uncharacterised protein [uncultured archaeon]